jgi:hypothetical protein
MCCSDAYPCNNVRVRGAKTLRITLYTLPISLEVTSRLLNSRKGGYSHKGVVGFSTTNFTRDWEPTLSWNQFHCRKSPPHLDRVRGRNLV